MVSTVKISYKIFHLNDDDKYTLLHRDIALVKVIKKKSLQEITGNIYDLI